MPLIAITYNNTSVRSQSNYFDLTQVDQVVGFVVSNLNASMRFSAQAIIFFTHNELKAKYHDFWKFETIFQWFLAAMLTLISPIFEILQNSLVLTSAVLMISAFLSVTQLAISMNFLFKENHWKIIQMWTNDTFLESRVNFLEVSWVRFSLRAWICEFDIFEQKSSIQNDF